MTGPGLDATMSVVRANLIAIAWLPLSGLLVLGPFLLVHGREAIYAALVAATDLRFGITALLLGVVVHELLHAAGFLAFGRVPRESVRLGFQRRTLTPFASCSVAVTADAYRAAALLPALALGLLPAFAAWWLGSGVLILWSWLMLALAGGDLAAVWAIRAVPGHALVLDHPQRVGCRLLQPGAS